MNVLGRVLHAVVRALARTVIVGASAAIAVAVLIPRVGGAVPYTILTGSMRPGMPPGTLVVVKPVPVRDIGVGDVITFQLTSGDPTVVTHRVVSVGVRGRDQRVFVTQGDSNPAPDPRAVLPVQVKGERWYAVPYLGYVTSLVTGPERRVATLVIATGLILYALAMFVSAAFERRSGSHAPRRPARHMGVSK